MFPIFREHALRNAGLATYAIRDVKLLMALNALEAYRNGQKKADDVHPFLQAVASYPIDSAFGILLEDFAPNFHAIFDALHHFFLQSVKQTNEYEWWYFTDLLEFLDPHFSMLMVERRVFLYGEAFGKLKTPQLFARPVVPFNDELTIPLVRFLDPRFGKFLQTLLLRALTIQLAYLLRSYAPYKPVALCYWDDTTAQNCCIGGVSQNGVFPLKASSPLDQVSENSA